MRATIELPLSHHLSACAGWLELGSAAYAAQELNQLPAELQKHPAVLEARCEVEFHREGWNEALGYARTLVEIEPEHPGGWVYRAYALRRCPEGGVQQAWDALLPAGTRFPKEPTVAYNLACYACQLRQLEEARLWLKRAWMLDDKQYFKRQALLETDLEPLWEEIRAL